MLKKNNKTHIVVITGPTAIGKSSFAVDYATKNNGEIISADSRQVYTGLDIGTGKITKKEMAGIPHYLLDVADPKKQFNVDKYKELAQKAIEEISARGKLPIICGGTGFYIDAVVKNISYPHVPHNIKLRKSLELKDAKYLYTKLLKLDPSFAKKLNNSEQNNTHRLTRSIELATALGTIPKVKKATSPYKVTWIVLKMESEKLKKRIYDRLIDRLNNGIIKEVENLHTKGLSWKRMEALGLEYRYIARFLQKKITREEMIEHLKNEIWHYARRQISWMKRYK